MTLTVGLSDHSAEVAVGATILGELPPTGLPWSDPEIAPHGVLRIREVTRSCSGGLVFRLEAVSPGKALVQVPNCTSKSGGVPCRTWILQVFVR